MNILICGYEQQDRGLDKLVTAPYVSRFGGWNFAPRGSKQKEFGQTCNESSREILKSPSLVLVASEFKGDDSAVLLCDAGALKDKPEGEALDNLRAWLSSQGFDDGDRDALLELTNGETWQQIINDIHEWLITP